MSTEEHKTALKEYGAAIIAGSRPETLDVPVFELDSKDFLSLLDNINSQNDEELKTGFYYSLRRQLEKNFQKYDENTQSQIKSTLLTCAQTIKNEKLLFGILAALNSLFTMSNGDWPELISFIFSDSDPEANDQLRSHILSSFTFLRSEGFINAHSQQLIPLIQRFLKINFPNISKSMLLSILSLCLQGEIVDNAPNDDQNQDDSIEKVSITEDLFNDVWEVAIEIANTPKYHSVYPALQQMCQNVKDFRNHASVSVKKITETFSDSNSDLESRLTTIIPLLRLFPFLDDQTILGYIVPSAIECLTFDYFASMSIIQHISEADVELFENDLITALWKLLLTEINENTNKRNAAIALFAPLADQIINTIDDSLDIIIQSIVLSLNAINDSNQSHEGAQFTALVAITTLRSIIPRFEKDNSEIFHSLLPHTTTCDNETLLHEANKTMRELLETGHFSTPEYEKELIDLFPKFNDINIGLFAKLIKSLISGDEEPGLSLAEPVYDFALPFLNKDSKLLRENALGLELFALLAQISNDYVEDQVQDGLDVATTILSSNESEYFPPAALFLSVIAVSFAEESRETILKVLPRLIEIVGTRISYSNDQLKIEPKQLANVAVSTCEIVKEFDLRDSASELAQDAIDMLRSKDGFQKINRCGAEMLNIISKCLLPDDANKVFKNVTQYLTDANSDERSEAEKELDNDIAENSIHALKKILKKYKSISFDDADEITKRLFGELGGIRGLPTSIEQIEDPETYVFSYIKTFIIRFNKNANYKNKIHFYIKSLMRMSDIIDNEVLPLLLDPIEAAIDNKILPDEDVYKFLEHITSMIDVEDSDITTSLLTAITSIVRSYIQVVDIPKMINLLNFLWDNVDETEEDVELPMAIAMITLELYSNTEEKEKQNDEGELKFDEQLLIELLGILPLPPDICDLEHVISSVLKIADKNWARSKEEILISISVFMAKVCLMKKNDLDQYDVTPGTIPQMRKKLKEIASSSKNIENQLKTEFQDKASSIAAILK